MIWNQTIQMCWKRFVRGKANDESEAIAPATTVSTEFEQAPPLATVEHISHTAGDTTVGIVHHPTDMVL